MIAATKSTTEITTSNVGFRPWLIVILGSVFYGYQFIIRVSPSMMTDELMGAFSIDATSLGIFTSCYYIAYSIAQIPLGIMLDRIGPRLLFAGCCAILAAGCLIFAETNNLYVACFARLLIGLGAACGFIGTLKLGTIWIPGHQFGRVVAIAVIFGTIGAVLGESPLEYLINSVGWRDSLRILGLFGSVLTAVLFVWLSNDNPKIPYVQPPTKISSMISDLKVICFSGQVWLVSIYSMLMYMPLTIIGDLWGVSFVERAYHIQETAAATVISMMFIGVFVGSPVFAILSDAMKNRRFPLFIAAFFNLVFYVVALYSQSIPIMVMYVLFFLVGFFFGGKSIGFTVVVESMPKSMSGATVGFVNTVIMSNGILSLPLIGWLLDFGKNHYYPDSGGYLYSVENFRFALAIIPVSLALATLLVVWVKDSYPKEHLLQK